MSLQSMTGFARHLRNSAGAQISWEIKSVNGKGLDVRFRLPAGFEAVEQKARALFSEHFKRGNFQAALSVELSAGSAKATINQPLLKELAAIAAHLREEYGLAASTPEGLMALRGVLEIPQEVTAPEHQVELERAVLGVLDETLIQLGHNRQAEGKALGEILTVQIATIEMLVEQAKLDPNRSIDAVRARLAAQVALLLDAAPALDEARLHMEAAFLATKADIQEELDRLEMHIASARNLIREGNGVGRKLDFLTQEFNREANTLCSKANAASITTIGLDLKAVVDQLREQIQNLE
ncbi:YicC/YloC family endoribonuclease [Phyllobacterium zundukense]|uniref:YicC family protein n=1 Tax=Phyllobacterium zundukense TaxID=1867719 RepID=A0A2N9W3Q1_9HYPH|nr:YicC/YloC family endoribonuclease [Phyllobacterium zundukense]ATU92157.1 YicC family protein [Phyllobacterium zundukense]PIO46369.1 YicC family protein [Phyllobacterium zundukense]